MACSPSGVRRVISPMPTKETGARRRDEDEARARDEDEAWRTTPRTLTLPVKLNDKYTCQGRQQDGKFVTFDDLCEEGDLIPTFCVGDEEFGPFGVVVRREDGLWIEPEATHA